MLVGNIFGRTEEKVKARGMAGMRRHFASFVAWDMVTCGILGRLKTWLGLLGGRGWQKDRHLCASYYLCVLLSMPLSVPSASWQHLLFVHPKHVCAFLSLAPV